MKYSQVGVRLMDVHSPIHLIVLLLIGLALSQAALAVSDIHQPAPSFSATSTQGVAFDLADQRGKYVVLEWTNHLCPYVKKHYRSGNMQELQKKYTAKGVEWVSIVSSARGKQGYIDEAKANQLTSERRAAPSHVILDAEGKIGRMYGAKTTPHMFVIDPQGQIAYMGAIDSIASADRTDIKQATNYLDAALTSLMAGESVKDPVTLAYGCSVKY